MGISSFEQAEKRFEQFKSELSWYMSEKLTSQTSLSDDLMQKKLQKLQEEFVSFRQALSDVLSIPHEGHPYAHAFASAVYLDTTFWYADYLEKHLFPQGWSDDFAAYLEKSKGVVEDK